MVVILAYHEIGPASPGSFSVSEDAFVCQARYLRDKGYVSLTIGQLATMLQERRPLPRKAVVLTFDDGTVDHATIAFPILRAHGLVGTFYVTAGYAGTTRWAEIKGPKRNQWYNSRPPHFPEHPDSDRYRRFDFMTWSQAAEMRDAGMEIASHTLYHPYLTALPMEEAAHEICASKKMLEERLETAIASFCYPYGDRNEDVAGLVRQADYTNAAVTRPLSGERDIGADMYALPRQSIGPSVTLGRYALIGSGWDRRLRALPGMSRLLSVKRWLRL